METHLRLFLKMYNKSSSVLGAVGFFKCEMSWPAQNNISFPVSQPRNATSQLRNAFMIRLLFYVWQNPLCVEKAEPAFHGRVCLSKASCVGFLSGPWGIGSLDSGLLGKIHWSELWNANIISPNSWQFSLWWNVTGIVLPKFKFFFYLLTLKNCMTYFLEWNTKGDVCFASFQFEWIETGAFMLQKGHKSSIKVSW